MGKREVRYLPSAQADIEEAVAYLMREEAEAAAIFLDALDQAAARLAAFPEAGPLARDRRLAAKGYRVMVAGRYLMIYVLRGEVVWVLRVMHGRRNYPASL